jgi:hypothetical protein
MVDSLVTTMPRTGGIFAHPPLRLTAPLLDRLAGHSHLTTGCDSFAPTCEVEKHGLSGALVRVSFRSREIFKHSGHPAAFGAVIRQPPLRLIKLS